VETAGLTKLAGRPRFMSQNARAGVWDSFRSGLNQRNQLKKFRLDIIDLTGFCPNRALIS